MRTFVVQQGEALRWTIDPEVRFARVPGDHVIKGLFCQSLIELLEGDWALVRPQLTAPPPDGRYIAYRDYPQIDYCRIAYAAARRLFPEYDLPEAARLLARQDLMVFAASPMGRILFRSAWDVQPLLLHLPSLYRMVVRGGRIVSTLLSDGAVRLAFHDYHGWLDCYTIGTIEGVLMHYDREPRITVTLESEVDATYDVRWS